MHESTTRSLALAALVMTLLIAAPATAATRFVTTTGTANASCAAATPCDLRYAVETVAVSGDEVVIAPGTYNVTDSITISHNIDVHGDPAQAKPLISKSGTPNANPPIHITGVGARLAWVDVTEDEVFTSGIIVDANATLENMTVRTAGDYGEAFFMASPAVLRNLMALTTGQDAAAVSWQGGSGTGTLRGVTAYAAGSGTGSNGIAIFGATLDARNVLARGPAASNDISVTGSGKLTTNSSNYRLSNTTVDSGSALDSGAGNQTASDPTVFSSADPHERLASVTRNAGTVDGLTGATDIDGQPRTQEGAPDIGADEFPDLSPGPPLPAANLLQNPGAEGAPGAANGVDAPPIPGWTSSGPFTAVKYGTTGFPNGAEGVRIGGGSQFFAGGPLTPSSQAVQVADLSAYAADIDAGRATASLAGMLGGFGLERDSATVTAVFKDAGGTAVGQPLKLGPVGVYDRGGETAFAFRQAQAAVPAGARHVEVTMADTRLNGSYADGYVDNLALTVAVLAPTPGALRDSTAPTLSRFGASRRRFAVARAGASKKKRKVPRGTTLRLRLSENASVTVTVQRPQSGRRSGKRCVAPRKGLRKKKKCTRYISVGSTSYNGHQGDNRFAFSGRLGRRALRPGRYRLSARGKDAAGNISAPKTLTITIVRA